MDFFLNACVLLSVGSTGLVQPGPVFPSVALQSDKIALSGSIEVALALEGPAPLRVELPKDAEKLLAPESANVWQIRPLGPPHSTSLDGNRERWEQHYRFAPFVPGEKVPIIFAPLKVAVGAELNPRDVAFPTKEVRVQTTLTEAKPENSRPVTGIEELPTVPPPPPESFGWQFAAILGAIFFSVLVGVLIRKWRAKPPPAPPGQWAAREFARLERDLALERLTNLAAADRLAAILREYIESRHGLAATKRTTAELLSACTGADWPPERTRPLGEILDRCDRAKYAADPPTDPIALINQAREWLRSAESPPCTGGLPPLTDVRKKSRTGAAGP
jgi:hypothetical protein